MKSFQQTQLDFARYLRAPDEHPIPAAMEVRRMEIYRDLIFSNIENLLAGVFPVLRSILSDQQWHAVIRRFIQFHRCQTPYFLEISEEFLQFIVQEKALLAELPFVAELAHYEWVELALEISEAQLPDISRLPHDIFAASFCLSPLSVVLRYQYPVHKISPQFNVTTSAPVELVVYRNRADKVCFMAVNPLTSRLLYLIETKPDSNLSVHLAIISEELQHPHPKQLHFHAELLVKALCELDVLHPTA